MPLVPDDKVVDFDKYGHCSLCHKDLRIKQMTSDGPVEVFTPEHDEINFLLNDSSTMRVCVCKSCQAEGIDDKQEEIMDSVYKGWYMETMYLVEDKKKTEWTEEKRLKYLNNYANKELVCVSDNVPIDKLEQKLKKYKMDNIDKKVRKKYGNSI